MKIMDALEEVILSIKAWADKNKVAKVAGKDLSTNDYTNIDKTKVDNMANGLVRIANEVFLSKDGIPVSDGVSLATGEGGNITVNGIGPDENGNIQISTSLEQVQTDWSQEDEVAVDYIKNKPTALPNPQALTFTGAAEGTYDGSEAVSIEIPQQKNITINGIAPDENGNINYAFKRDIESMIFTVFAPIFMLIFGCGLGAGILQIYEMLLWAIPATALFFCNLIKPKKQREDLLDCLLRLVELSNK